MSCVYRRMDDYGKKAWVDLIMRIEIRIWGGDDLNYKNLIELININPLDDYGNNTDLDYKEAELIVERLNLYFKKVKLGVII